MPKLIEAAWLSYEKSVIPPDAPEVQRVESRRAFYAGAMHLQAIMFRELGDDPMPTPADEAFMRAIVAELQAYARDELGL